MLSLCVYYDIYAISNTVCGMPQDRFPNYLPQVSKIKILKLKYLHIFRLGRNAVSV